MRCSWGTRSSIEAVHTTFVSPHSTRHEPAANFITPRVNVTGLSRPPGARRFIFLIALFIGSMRCVLIAVCCVLRAVCYWWFTRSTDRIGRPRKRWPMRVK